jgi:hypothetical protein
MFAIDNRAGDGVVHQRFVWRLLKVDHSAGFQADQAIQDLFIVVTKVIRCCVQQAHLLRRHANTLEPQTAQLAASSLSECL